MAKYSKAMRTCKRARVATLKGRFGEPPAQYGKYAYWCGLRRGGWVSKPCEHALGTVHEEVSQAALSGNKR